MQILASKDNIGSKGRAMYEGIVIVNLTMSIPTAYISSFKTDQIRGIILKIRYPGSDSTLVNIVCLFVSVAVTDG